MTDAQRVEAALRMIASAFLKNAGTENKRIGHALLHVAEQINFNNITQENLEELRRQQS